jgi:uncharacterized protein involved in cysteine biosynthesis
MVNEHHSFAPKLPEGTLPPNKLVWRPAIGSALVAGLLAAVGTSVPIVPLAMLCMFAAGGLAVTLYRRRAGYHTVTPWMGAKLGLLSGALGFGLRAIMIPLILFSASQRMVMRKEIVDKMQEAISAAADPDVRQAMEQFRGYIATDHGLVILVLFFLAVAAVFFLIFSALGGALGAAIFGRDGASKE